MKKHIKKRIAKFFLNIFLCNIIIAPKTEAVAIPVVIAAPTAKTLLTAGAALAGIIGTFFAVKHKNFPDMATTILNPAAGEISICKESTSPVIPSVASDIVREIVEEKQVSNIAPGVLESTQVAGSSEILNQTVPANRNDVKISKIDDSQPSELSHEHINHVPLTTAKAYVETLTKSASKKISNKMLDNLVGEFCKNNQQAIISYAQVENAFRVASIPYGIQVEAPAASCKFTAQLSNQSAINAQRMATIQACWDLHMFQAQMRDDKATRAKVLQDVRAAVNCLTQTQCLPHTQACDLTQRIEACLVMDKLYIESPVVKELSGAIENLRKIYFHQDGSLCWNAFYKNTNAPSIIIECVDSMHKQLGSSVAHTELIQSTIYNELRSAAKSTACNETGISCSNHHSYASNGRQFNQEILNLIESCKHYDFEKAHAIQQQYSTCPQLQNIVDYYKVQYQNALNAIFDNDGIVRVAQKDPAYIANRDLFHRASITEKEIINQNLLMRHHIKEIMHKRWNIPQSCPQEIHNALYQIIGNDSSSLSKLGLFQQKVQHIIQTAPQGDYDKLVGAFYEPNGVLKEYALHLPDAKNIELPNKILTPTYSTEREQLNTLICMQIKKPEYSKQAQESIHNLEHWLNTSNSKEQIDAKTAFNHTYEAIMNQEQKVKISSQSQAQNIVDANSSAPMPPDPEFENTKKSIKSNVSKQEIENKANHCFGKKSLEKHNLSEFLTSFNGDKISAYEAILENANKYVADHGLTEVNTDPYLDISLGINGFDIQVRVKIIKGITRITTAFIP